MLVLCAAVTTIVGCAQQDRTLVEVFPPGTMATPWILSEPAWSGTFDEAGPALGEEADLYASLHPRHVWLANYHHESRPSDKLTVRMFSFDSRDAAFAAHEYLKPAEPKPFDAGDGGYWTDDGVCFTWGRLLVEIFSRPARGPAQPEQAVYLLGILEKRMPAGLPGDPQ